MPSRHVSSSFASLLPSLKPASTTKYRPYYPSRLPHHRSHYCLVRELVCDGFISCFVLSKAIPFQAYIYLTEREHRYMQYCSVDCIGMYVPYHCIVDYFEDVHSSDSEEATEKRGFSRMKEVSLTEVRYF